MVLAEITPNLWTAAQPFSFLGLEIGTRMTVVRLPGGGLVLVSPIKLSDSHRQALDELGDVQHIVAPNLFHHLFVGGAQAIYPEAKTWGVAGLPEKRPDLRFDALLTEPGSFENTLEYLPFQGFASILPSGVKLAHETVFYHRPSRTLILTDTSFNFDETNRFPVRLVGWIGGSYKNLSPSRLEKWGTRDKAAVEASVREVLKWDFDRVIPGHGSVVDSGGNKAYKSGFEWFLGKEL
jgi:glyoxylase-like metal-dependent hydrolase (beta-lactamase superfamily II)